MNPEFAVDLLLQRITAGCDLLFDPARSSLYGEHTAPVLGSPKLRLAWHFRVSPRSPTAKSGLK
jgi:hypothetical protein